VTEEELKALDWLCEQKRLIKAQTSYDPQTMWHPDFGWVLRDGKPTENTEAFQKWLEEHRE